MSIKDLHDLIVKNHEQVLAYFNSKLEKSLSTPPARVRPRYATGSVKNGKIKIEHRDPSSGAITGEGWKMVTAGMVQGPDGHAVSAKRPNEGE